ncbi:MAG: DNA helicase RecQ [Methanolobus sp.]|uniref:DNA helicase RecQ n=1 Tax=Methanolobus sp. TaxID=1874737 RepID=UPI00272FE377|nr:DNA helicase RecQ [Methanolobus sp.]MDP2217821.1 DNA helicase RecQ [Methanolobus sp.]
MYQTLQKYFGYSEFRPLQKDIIQDVLDGKDTFVLMPTGGGKSLCYQLPALLMDGLTVVISPLISLMKDQVDSLRANGVNAAFLNSTQNYTESRKICDDIATNDIKILYMAPERLAMSGTLSMITKAKVSLFAIDESHCISEWGHDFRPEYRKLSMLKKKFPKVPIIALTATATPKVREDTLNQLGLTNPKTYIASFNRSNLLYEIRPKKETYDQMLQYLRRNKGKSGIIYCQSRKNVDTVTAKLRKDGFNALPYHAGLSDTQRGRNQEAFIKDKADIIVATIAFGMGIDKPNVRFVIHYDLPKNLEGYYQETGRGGRDGLECECILFFSHGDRYRIEYFVKQKGRKEERDIALKQLQDMVNYCVSTTCRRKALLSYFGEELEEDNCGGCDACLRPKEMVDGTEEAKLLISCVDELGERYGMNHVIDVLCGANIKRVKEKKHDKLKTYNSGCRHTRPSWQDMAREMVQQGVVAVEGSRYPLLKLNKASREVMQGSRKVTFTRVAPLEFPDTLASEDDEVYEPYELDTIAKPVPPPSTRKTVQSSDSELFARLKDLRKEMAELQDVPPYIVFADTSLKQMAAKKPSTKAEMLKITGVGEYKLKKYGDIFLREISNYCEEKNDGSPKSAVEEKAPSSQEQGPIQGTIVPEQPAKIKTCCKNVPDTMKRETILKTISGLEKELIILARGKLGDSVSEEEIKEVWAEILSGSRQA